MINQIELDMMRGMVSILNEASNAYYNTGNPIMTDAQFDARLRDLKQLEEETGFVLSNSPTINVGAKVLSELQEVTHNHLMLSLEKCHTVDEIIKFSNNKELVASIKLDGLTASLLYENGELTRAETRGDGIKGNNVTEHIKRFKNVPLKIDKQGTYIIDGECIIIDDDFSEINKNNEYKNSRNLAAGTLSVLDTSLVAQRKLSFYAWDVIEGGSTNNLKDNLNEARTMGFDTVPSWVATNLDPKNLQDNIDYVFDFAVDEGLPNDGIVFKFNDIEYGKSLGKTEHHFKNGIAYKREDDKHKTKLIDMDWTMGKTGTLTPTAIFEPVEIDGTTVERASVHNISILTSLDLHIGDTIEVYKANQIIPQIHRNVSADERMALGKEFDYIAIPSVCPICGGNTEIKQDNDSKVLVCTNDNCKGKLLGKLTHFVSKNAMNIDGMSEATIEKFIKLSWLSSFEDIYNLKNYSIEMMKLEGFGEKSVKKLLNAIEASKDTTLDRFIYSLSIPLIGRTASKTIAKFFEGDFAVFYKAFVNPFDWTALDDFGGAMNDSIVEYAMNNGNMIRNLARHFTFEKAQNVAASNILTGKTFCITGSLNHFANRDEAKERIESAGGKVSGSVSVKTSYLVNNDVTSTSGKNKKAKELGVSIISEEELIKMLNS
ncbi:MAG: NAD-dependent DNA ligase LigA [Paludibacteraceae bacterium]|nr:NAD-dependent DNA ligase LigA [Paludibacteraceae bacterium]